MKDVAAKSFEDAFGRLSLYCRGAEALEAGAAAVQSGTGGTTAAAAEAATAATAALVLRHIGRTVGGECVDQLYRWARATYCPGDTDDDDVRGGGGLASPLPLLPASDRQRVARACPPDVAAGLTAATEAAASAAEPRAMEAGLERAAAEVGLWGGKGKRGRLRSQGTMEAGLERAAVEAGSRLTILCGNGGGVQGSRSGAPLS